MGRRSGLDVRLLAPLLALLLLGASAAVPTENEARRAARAALDRGDLTGAKKLIDDALARFGKRDSDAVWALRVMHGEVLVGFGEGDAARKALAFALPPRLATSDTAVRQLIIRMYAEPQAARELGQKARQLAAAHQPAALADVLLAIANTHGGNAEALAREAIPLARKHGRKASEAKAMASLMRVLNQKQEFGEAVEWGERSLALARPLGNAKTLQQIEGNLGWSYTELGDYETAAELFTSAEKTAARINAKVDRVPWLIQLGNISMARREWQAAERYTALAVPIAREIRHPQLGLALANLSRTAFARGDLPAARRLNTEALQFKKDDRDAELRSHILEARILTVEGRHADAQKLLNDVLRETRVEMIIAEAAGELAALHVRTKQPALAEAQFKRALGAARRAHAEVTDRELRFSLSNTTDEIFGEYVDFLARSRRIDDALAVTETRRAQLLEEGLAVPEKLDARAIARQNDATILCYSLGRDRSYLWIVTKSDVSLHELPPDTTIEKAAEAYSRQLLTDKGTMQASGRRGEELYRMLVPAAAAIAKDSRVIVIADGKLHALNFETLVVPAPQRHYWIEDVVVMNASSLQLLARAARKPAATPSILLVGNPPAVDPKFPPLRFAAAELRAIEKRFPRRAVLEGPKATPAAYKSAAPEKFDYVHFVAHGVATRKRPLDSAVILAPDAASRYKLLARDVVDQKLTARLVTISSCYGAGTRTYRGEGVVGFAWAFLRAGADQVVAALWAVNDAATPKLMDQMYAGIRAGKDPAVALRDAKLQFVNGRGGHQRPFYWAPFVLYANV